MNEQELQRLVEHISITIFRKPFRHRASFNRRLKTTGGRYHLGSHDLDFNPLVLELHGMEELEKVVKHELCHYHLHLEGRGYQHRDADFLNLLKASGGEPVRKGPAPGWNCCAAEMALQLQCLRTDVSEEKKDRSEEVCLR